MGNGEIQLGIMSKAPAERRSLLFSTRRKGLILCFELNISLGLASGC